MQFACCHFTGRDGDHVKMAEMSECLPLPFPAIGFPAFLPKCQLPNISHIFTTW